MYNKTIHSYDYRQAFTNIHENLINKFFQIDI